MKILIFDTETTGLPLKGAHWEADYEKFPRIASIAWTFIEDDIKLIEQSFLIRPNGWVMPPEAGAVNGLTTERLQNEGMSLKMVLKHFLIDATHADRLIGHNIYFDTSMVKSELLRMGIKPEIFTEPLSSAKRYCTMQNATGIIGSKWPKLSEIYQHFFKGQAANPHTAAGDVATCYAVYRELIK